MATSREAEEVTLLCLLFLAEEDETEEQRRYDEWPLTTTRTRDREFSTLVQDRRSIDDIFSQRQEPTMTLDLEAIGADPRADPPTLGGNIPSSGSLSLSLSPTRSCPSPAESVPSPRSSVTSATPASPTRKRRRETPVWEAFLNRLKTLDQNAANRHGEEHCLNVIVEMLWKLPEPQRMDLKFDVHRMVFERTQEYLATQTQKS